jgi:cold shock protein
VGRKHDRQHDDRQHDDNLAITGVVKKIDLEKGFGFIRAGDVEFFFHRSAAIDFESLNQGAHVTFLPGEGPKGPRAEQVSRA